MAINTLVELEINQEYTLLAMVIEWGHLLSEVGWLEEQDFYCKENAEIWRAIQNLLKSGERTIDKLTLLGEVRKMRVAPATAGHIQAIFNDIFISRGIRIGRIASEMRKRRIEREMQNGVDLETIIELRQPILANESWDKKRITLKDAIHQVITEMQSGDDGRILTGYPRLDKQIGGLRPTDLIVISGRPSMGKTTFALNIAYNSAKQGKKSVYFNMEMTGTSLASKIFSAESGVDSVLMRDKNITETEGKKLYMTGSKITESDPPLIIYDCSRITTSQIEEFIKSEEKVDLIVVDQLPKIKEVIVRNRKDLELADHTLALKAIAKDYKIPVILLHQTNREVEKREHQIPNLSDLKDSSAVEQDADVVIFLHRNSYYSQDKDDLGMLVKVAKNKMGDTGHIGFTFNMKTSKITENDKQEDEVCQTKNGSDTSSSREQYKT